MGIISYKFHQKVHSRSGNGSLIYVFIFDCLKLFMIISSPSRLNILMKFSRNNLLIIKIISAKFHEKNHLFIPRNGQS